MGKFRLHIEAEIASIEVPPMDWMVPHATGTYEFHDPRDLYVFISKFAKLLGAVQP